MNLGFAFQSKRGLTIHIKISKANIILPGDPDDRLEPGEASKLARWVGKMGVGPIPFLQTQSESNTCTWQSRCSGSVGWCTWCRKKSRINKLCQNYFLLFERVMTGHCALPPICLLNQAFPFHLISSMQDLFIEFRKINLQSSGGNVWNIRPISITWYLLFCLFEINVPVRSPLLREN